MIGCSQPGATPKEAASAGPVYKTDLPIQDVMDMIIDPSADFIWESVSTEIGPKGIVNKAPSTDDEWKAVRSRAMIIMEASNMLKIPGREVAHPGTKSTSPGIEEEPEEIKKLIAGDLTTWHKKADGLYEAASQLLKAAEKKDTEGILDYGNKLDEACESCHINYWYPKQTQILKDLAAGSVRDKK
jgi:hypothetical protein